MELKSIQPQNGSCTELIKVRHSQCVLLNVMVFGDFSFETNHEACCDEVEFWGKELSDPKVP